MISRVVAYRCVRIGCEDYILFRVSGSIDAEQLFSRILTTAVHSDADASLGI